MEGERLKLRILETVQNCLLGAYRTVSVDNEDVLVVDHQAFMNNIDDQISDCRFNLSDEE